MIKDFKKIRLFSFLTSIVLIFFITNIDNTAKKRIVDEWFNYLQIQISSEFQKIENNFSKRPVKFKISEWKKKNINEGVSEMAVKTRLAQLNKRTQYQKKWVN